MVSNQLRSEQWAVQSTGIRLKAAAAHLALAFSLLAVLAAASGTAHAQNTGSVFGSVQDKSGAVIPKAAITIADTEKGISRTVTSNGSGQFNITQLGVGDYILTVTSANFETAVITGIHVDANANLKETVVLQPGNVTDTISVVAESTSVDPRSAQLQTLIDNHLIEDLPIDGHNVVALSALLPGVVDVNAPATFTGDTAGPTYAASGSRNTQNLFLFDGLIFNNLYYNTGVNYPTPNALQEVSVILNNYKAQYGRNAGSVFNVVTKRGTNTFHGAVWDYLQNQLFNAADYLTHVNPKDNQNQFGFTVQGPVIIPHLYNGRDKLFFAAAYQQLIGHLATTASAPTPNLNERGLNNDGTPFPCAPTGPFAGMQCASFQSAVESVSNGITTIAKFTNPLDLLGTGTAGATGDTAVTQINNIYLQSHPGLPAGTQSPCITLLNAANAYAAVNPYLGTKIQASYLPFAQVPVACLDPVILSNNPSHPGIFDKYAPPPNVGPQLVTSSPDPTSDKNGFFRVDFNLNPYNSLSAEYNVSASGNNAPPGVNSNSQGVATYELVNAHAKLNFGNVSYQRILTANLLNSMRVGYKRFESFQFPDDTETLNSFGGNFVETGLPTLPVISLGSSVFNLGSTNQGYQDHVNENVEVLDTVNYTRGNHSIQGGFNFLRLQYLTRMDYPGQIAFSTTFTGLTVGDAELGLANSVTAQNRLIQGGIQHDVFAYIQDDWRATSKLTIDYGLRYELPFQWFQPKGQAATFVPGLQSRVFPQAPGGLGFPGDPTVLPSLVPTDFNGIAPRFGFAYDTTGQGKFLIRGGFGIFFDAVNANVIGVGEPYHFNLFELTPPGGASNPLLGYGPNGGVLTLPGAFNPKNPQFIAPYSLFFPDRNFRTPYLEAINLGFQYRIPHGGTLEANYVGKLAHKLTVPVDLNPDIFDCSGGYYKADPSRYCINAAATAASETNRVRFADFNYGGQGIVDIQSVANSNYNALQVQYTQRGGKYLNILSSYTYSKSIDIQTNGQSVANSVPDVFNLSSDRGPSDNNVKHNVTLGWVTRYPRVAGFTAPVRAVLNDWVYSGQYFAHTGRPFSVTINNDTALDGEPNQRAAIVPGMNPLLPKNRHRTDKVYDYFNPNAFTYPNIGTFSNLSRNSFTGPGYILTDMALARDFPLASVREGMRLSFRAEAFNVFNTPNLNQPNSVFSCTTTSISTQITPQNINNPPAPTTCTSTVLPNGTGQSTPGQLGGVLAGTGHSSIGEILSTYGNNGNTSTNGRKFQFSLTLFY